MTRKPEPPADTTTATNQPAPTPKNEANAAPRIPDRPVLKRGKKRVIKREQVKPGKLATTKAPPKPQPKRKPAPTPKAPTTPPSEIRLEALNASLNGYQVWIQKYPLAVGMIEKQIFQHIAAHSLSASKRVVKKLLHRHTHDRRYLQAIKSGESRYNLDGTEAGAITQAEKEHAARMLQS